ASTLCRVTLIYCAIKNKKAQITSAICALGLLQITAIGGHRKCVYLLSDYGR
ncbi:hypothetical protein D046_5694B, partial [Vibrio parahaemolyticus V-223/04]